MLLTIVRHGETGGNVSDTLQGQRHGELSAKGRRQAEALAKCLSAEHFDAIWSTDLQRGLDTTKLICWHHSVPVRTDPLLRERHFGVFQGKNRTKFYAHENALDHPFDHRPEGGESFLDLRARAERFIDMLNGKYHDESILIVAHGDTIRMMLGVIQGLSVQEARQIAQLNGCLNVLRLESEGRFEVVVRNSVDHLPEKDISSNKTAV